MPDREKMYNNRELVLVDALIYYKYQYNKCYDELLKNRSKESIRNKVVRTQENYKGKE